MITAPIWKDTYYTTTEDVLSYYISVDDEVIFRGKAYRMPNADTLRININKVCQNFLSCDIEELLMDEESTSMTNSDAFRTFVMYDEDGNVLETFNFLYSWNYEPWDGTIATLSQPVNGHTATNMLHLNTQYTSDGVVTSKTSGAYPVTACGDWALYYLNSNGGWDSFLVEGSVVKSEKITQHTYNKSFNNNTIEFEEGRYISEIVTNYTMTTGWLSDVQSANLVKNLLASNTVYIHDLKEDRIIPAVITNTENTYKTYQNQGKEMVNYTIKIKESQTKIRK